MLVGQLHRRIARAEEAGRAGRDVASFGRRVERDVVGHLAVGLAELAGEHGARGRDSARWGRPAGRASSAGRRRRGRRSWC